jgi:hypothetical protein
VPIAGIVGPDKEQEKADGRPMQIQWQPEKAMEVVREAQHV